MQHKILRFIDSEFVILRWNFIYLVADVHFACLYIFSSLTADFSEQANTKIASIAAFLCCANWIWNEVAIPNTYSFLTEALTVSFANISE